MKKIKEYFDGVRKEFSRIRWLSGKDLFKYAGATVVFIIVFAIFFLGVDAATAYVRNMYEGTGK